MSTLGFALLGLLAKAPATGYDLARELRRPVGHFWSARHSQVYPALARLDRDGLVEHQVVEGAGPRDTKRYTVTAAGLDAVQTWLRGTTPDVDPREILLRVYLVWLLPDADALAVLQAIREHHQRQLATYEAIADGSPLPLEPGTPSFGDRATLRWGIAFERGRIEWVDELIACVS